MIKIYGNLEVNDGVRIVTGEDLCLYYKWFVDKYLYNTIRTQLPRHLAHCTIVNPTIHNITNFKPVKHLHGIAVDFWIDPTEIYESRINFWLPVKCNIEKLIKDTLKAKDGPDFWGLHLVICNKGKVGKPNAYVQCRN